MYVEELDFGKYTCKASNSFGEDAKSMELFGRQINSKFTYNGCHEFTIYLVFTFMG